MTDHVYQQLREHLAYLKLGAVAEQLAAALAGRRERQAVIHPVPARPARRRDPRDRAATARRSHAIRELPAHKTLEQFDYDAQPTLDRRLVEELATLRFIEEKANVLLIGPPDPVSHCPPRCRHWSNSPVSVSDTLILRPFRRPLVTWTASSSPRWTLCKTVWRTHPSRLAASASGR